MDDLPLEKIAIPGPTLASMIQRLSSAAGDVDGLLFGTVAHVHHSTHPDDDLSASFSSAEPSSLIATVTGFFSATAATSFLDSSSTAAAARLSIPAVRRILAAQSPRCSLFGWFSARRRTPLRPSMRERSVSSALSASFLSGSGLLESPSFRPIIFLLLATPVSDQIIHTHEYQAYQYHPSTDHFDPKSVCIINIGPEFRCQYNAFSPTSSFPVLPCELGNSSSAMAEDRDGESLNDLKRITKAQQELDMCTVGCEIGNLSRLMGSQAANYTSGLDDLYKKMLAKLEGLAQLVEKSSAKVIEQENYNRQLRYKVAGLD